MRQKKPNKITEFLAEKGFYIILILCIAAIGISGYVLFFSESDTPDDDTLYVGDPQNPATTPPQPLETELQTEIPDNAVRDTEVVMAPDASDEEDAKPVSNDVISVLPDSDAEETGGSGKDAKPVIEAPTPSKQPTASFYVWPVNGELLERFSVDELVFNETMGDWRVHPGLDIAAALGAQVCAMGDGVVEDVYTDEMMGVTIVIDHGNKTKSVYRNLMDSVMVVTGDNVLAGDVIGGIGQTADNEFLDAPHLHLEVIRDGAQIDPCELLP